MLACYALIEMNRKLNHALASLVLMYSATAWSQEAVMATIKGPGGYAMSGSIECGGKVTSTIKPGERFIARELSDGEKDWEVYLKSGISGTIPRNRIRLLPDEPLAKLNFASCKKEWRKLQSKRIKMTDDVAYSAKKYYGVPNYYRTLQLHTVDGQMSTNGMGYRTRHHRAHRIACGVHKKRRVPFDYPLTT